MSKLNYILDSFIWGVLAKVLQSTVQFFTVPFLLAYFGKYDYGLIALAISINAYLQLLDMGVNTGGVKYFSEWIHSKNSLLLDSVARTSITFYSCVGLLNAFFLVLLAYKGLPFFNLEDYQVPLMKQMLLILAFVSVFNWGASVFNQLLIANQKIAYIQKVNIIKYTLDIFVVVLTIRFKLNILEYFFIQMLLNSAILIPLGHKARKLNLISSFLPNTDWKNFKQILNYSLALILMGVFQMSAVKLRPVILSIYSTKGLSIVSDFRVMEVITLFVISIGGILTSILLPKTTRLLLDGNESIIKSFIYKSVKYTSILSCFLCFPLILCSQEILTLYVGRSYTYLAPWLSVWLVAILLTMHKSPIDSLILSMGKTRMLVYSSAISCIISLVLNGILTPYLDSAAAVIGYIVYILIQISFYYFYFNSKILNLDSLIVFKSFIIPVFLAVVAIFISHFINPDVPIIYKLIVKNLSWAIIFFIFLLTLKVINVKELRSLLKPNKK